MSIAAMNALATGQGNRACSVVGVARRTQKNRRTWVSPCTEHPTYTWTTQQARNFQMHLQDEELPCEILMRDNDQKNPDSFDEVFRSTDCQIKRNTPASPNLQAHVERVVQTLKHEVLNAFCIVSDAHLDYILKTAMDWYNKRRGHSARDNLPPVRDESPPVSVDFSRDKIVCDTELGGHLKSYRRAA